MQEKFDLGLLIIGLVGDLHALREGKITIKEARARSELARTILDGVWQMMESQKFLEGQAIKLVRAK